MNEAYDIASRTVETGIMTDVEFRLLGDKIPVDHGYHLFSAVSKIVPELHGDNTAGIHPISGRLAGDRLLDIRGISHLRIRIAHDRVREVLPLAGRRLTIGGHMVSVGVPNTRGLWPSERLYSRLVVIKGYMEPECFLDAVKRQMIELGVEGTPLLIEQRHIVEENLGKRSGSHSPFLRRTLRVQDKEIVGFAVKIRGLAAKDSIRIQEIGLGGRRRFGCGIFVPDRFGKG